MRQWCLVSRREPYDAASGVHKLHWRHGGSFGHSVDLALDIETGVVSEDFSGRRWNVTVNTPSQRIAAQQEQSQEQTVERALQRQARNDAATERRIREDMATAIQFFSDAPGHQLTRTQLRVLAGWNSDRTGRVIAQLERAETIRTVQCQVPIGSGAMRPCQGYALNI